jgi:hypothetical protein
VPAAARTRRASRVNLAHRATIPRPELSGK